MLGGIPFLETVSVIKYEDQYRLPSENISIEELRELFSSKEQFLINTPDGPQNITKWIDLGKKPCISFHTEDEYFVVSREQPIQLGDNIWTLASNIKQNDKLIRGNDTISILYSEEGGIYDCFSFSVEHHNKRFWMKDYSLYSWG